MMFKEGDIVRLNSSAIRAVDDCYGMRLNKNRYYKIYSYSSDSWTCFDILEEQHLEYRDSPIQFVKSAFISVLPSELAKWRIDNS